MAATTEEGFVSALTSALAARVPPVPVWWGYAPQELAENPPSLPLVTVQRTSALLGPGGGIDFTDFCTLDDPTAPATASITLQVHVWAKDYQEARDLQAEVRAVCRALTDWQHLNEFDSRDGELRAWVISSDWLCDTGVLA